MAKTEAARCSGNCKRANKARPGRTQASIAEFERFSHYAGLILGICFGLMLFIGILAG